MEQKPYVFTPKIGPGTKKPKVFKHFSSKNKENLKFLYIFLKFQALNTKTLTLNLKTKTLNP